MSRDLSITQDLNLEKRDRDFNKTTRAAMERIVTEIKENDQHRNLYERIRMKRLRKLGEHKRAQIKKELFFPFSILEKVYEPKKSVEIEIKRNNRRMSYKGKFLEKFELKE